ncbi:MAG: ChbG/HpnK family deacetylase [Acutalibacteraceae bacterium]
MEELLKNQLITSTSVLTVAPSAKQAVDFSGMNHIDVGVHLTINSDYEDKKWQSLSNAASFQNGLPHNQKELIFKTARKDVRTELESQYRYIVDNGGTVDHADNHCATL